MIYWPKDTKREDEVREGYFGDMTHVRTWFLNLDSQKTHTCNKEPCHQLTSPMQLLVVKRGLLILVFGEVVRLYQSMYEEVYNSTKGPAIYNLCKQ